MDIGVGLLLAKDKIHNRPDKLLHHCGNSSQETLMNDEILNLGIRKFLKMVGINSQREIEQAVAKAVATGGIAGSETLSVIMTLEIPRLALEVKFDGDIQLQ
jgi:hypothetical protein